MAMALSSQTVSHHHRVHLVLLVEDSINFPLTKMRVKDGYLWSSDGVAFQYHQYHPLQGGTTPVMFVGL